MSLGEDLRTDAQPKTLKEIEPRAQRMLAILRSVVNMIGGDDLYDNLMCRKISSFDDGTNVHTSSENDETNGYGYNQELLTNHLALSACFISYAK